MAPLVVDPRVKEQVQRLEVGKKCHPVGRQSLLLIEELCLVKEERGYLIVKNLHPNVYPQGFLSVADSAQP